MSEKMKEYIEREAALKGQVPHYSTNGVEIIEGKAIPVEYIENLPAADVVEVRKGRWERVDYGNGLYNYHCSSCRHIPRENIRSNYCPNCGAKMDGGIKNDDNI